MDTKQFLTGSWELILPFQLKRHEAIEVIKTWGLKINEYEYQYPTEKVLKIIVSNGECHFVGKQKKNNNKIHIPYSMIKTN